MTMKEADSAARSALPVIYNGAGYQRIISVGIAYDRLGGVYQFVELLDKNGFSTARVRPQDVSLNLNKKGGNVL